MRRPAWRLGGYGKFKINAAGDWHYTTDTAHNEFVGGTTYTDTLTVSSADGTTHVLTVSIGTNDAAVITGTSSGSVEIADDGPGSGQLTDTGTLTDTDVDNPTTPSSAVTTATASTVATAPSR